MNNLFTVKVKYTKHLDSGEVKRVTEPYLLAGISFADAEARIFEELSDVINEYLYQTDNTRRGYPYNR